jgi:hypothetical protein
MGPEGVAVQLPFDLVPPFRHERPFGWLARLPGELMWAADSNDRPRKSPLELSENASRKLGPAHSAHAEVRERGLGRYSVWDDGWLYFSSSDNTDPNQNGRSYRLDLPSEDVRIALERIAEVDEAKERVIEAIRLLPPSFTPRQAYDALRGGLRLIYPASILAFNEDRLLQEFSWADEALQRYRRYLPEIQNAEVIFLSIMCSGRTWVRFFLQEYLTEVTGISFPLAAMGMAGTDRSPSLHFTHGFFDVFETIPARPWCLFENELVQRPLILLVRDPRDVVVSYYHYLRISQPERFSSLVPSGSLREFVESSVVGLERIATVHDQEIELFERHPGPKFMLRYEDLIVSASTEFLRLLRFLITNPVEEKEAFHNALRKSEFQQMQALEIEISRSGKAKDYLRLGVANWSGNVDDLKVRAGVVGGFKVLLPDLNDPAILAKRYPMTNKIVCGNTLTR